MGDGWRPSDAAAARASRTLCVTARQYVVPHAAVGRVDVDLPNDGRDVEPPPPTSGVPECPPDSSRWSARFVTLRLRSDRAIYCRQPRAPVIQLPRRSRNMGLQHMVRSGAAD